MDLKFKLERRENVWYVVQLSNGAIVKATIEEVALWQALHPSSISVTQPLTKYKGNMICVESSDKE